MTRLIVLFSLLFLVGCATRDVVPDFNDRSGLPVVQGLTNESATQFAVVAPEAMKLKFTVERVPPSTAGSLPATAAASKDVTIASEIRASPDSNIVVHHVMLHGLRLDVSYQLEIRDQYDQLVDQRLFRALNTKSKSARVIAASCLYDAFLMESRQMWKSVAQVKPDMVLLIGDNVYAEIANGRFPSPLDEKALWIRYSETFFALDFYKMKTLIPTLVTWDDHDYGMKDGNRENPNRLASKRVLEAFFPQSATPAFPQYEKGPGVSSKFDAFGYRFLLLDGRSFRSPNVTAAGGPTSEPETHFGDEQEQWIYRNVKESPAPVWLISGDQWFGGYHRFESYEGNHPRSFKTFMKTLYGSTQPVVFLSGDRHLSEVSKIEPAQLGYTTYEFTSSALHSKAHPSRWETIPNPRHVTGADLKPNFIMFDLTRPTPKNAIRVKGASIGPESKSLFTFDFTVAPVSGAP